MSEDILYKIAQRRLSIIADQLDQEIIQELTAQIHKEAEERYPIRKGCCRLERRQLLRLKQRYIENKMKEFGLKEEGNKVNS